MQIIILVAPEVAKESHKTIFLQGPLLLQILLICSPKTS